MNGAAPRPLTTNVCIEGKKKSACTQIRLQREREKRGGGGEGVDEKRRPVRRLGQGCHVVCVCACRRCVDLMPTRHA